MSSQHTTGAPVRFKTWLRLKSRLLSRPKCRMGGFSQAGPTSHSEKRELRKFDPILGPASFCSPFIRHVCYTSGLRMGLHIADWAAHWPMVLPYFDGKVPAGFPSPAEDYLETPLDLTEYLIENKAATFMMRVDGDSMKDAGILDGDLLMVDH